MESFEAGRGSPIPRCADELMCQECGISEEIEEPRPVLSDTKPVTEALTSAQIQEQYGARSEKDEVYEIPISIQRNDLDQFQAAELTYLGWSKVINCKEREFHGMV